MMCESECVMMCESECVMVCESECVLVCVGKRVSWIASLAHAEMWLGGQTKFFKCRGLYIGHINFAQV